MEEKRLYVITGLNSPFQGLNVSSIDKHIKKLVIDDRKVEVSIVSIIEHRKKYSNCLNFSFEPRYLVRIENGLRDDNFAKSLVNSLMLALALSYDIVMDENPLAIVVNESSYKDNTIRVGDLLGDKGIDSPEYNALSTGIGVPEEVIEFIWDIVPTIMENQYLQESASFYAESIGKVWVADDDVFEIKMDNSDFPLSPFDKASIETAYQNAFKAIEAVIGEPPDDIRKLRIILQQAGINPDEIVGYNLYDMSPGKETIIKKIIDMQRNRDKKAAHGKTFKTGRDIGYCELKDKQTLSQYIILSNIKFKQGK
jgi:hypothetical protein